MIVIGQIVLVISRADLWWTFRPFLGRFGIYGTACEAGVANDPQTPRSCMAAMITTDEAISGKMTVSLRLVIDGYVLKVVHLAQTRRTLTVHRRL